MSRVLAQPPSLGMGRVNPKSLVPKLGNYLSSRLPFRTKKTEFEVIYGTVSVFDDDTKTRQSDECRGEANKTTAIC